ncbi:MAG: DUF1206 domain-containing protein [Acidobacteriota bacterium]
MNEIRIRPIYDELKVRTERLAERPWMARLAKLGFAAKGFLYVTAGGTGILASLSVSGRPVGVRGALALLAGAPAGRLAVALVAAGLVGFILRRFVQSVVPPAGRPKRRIMRVLRPIGYMLSGLGHIGVGLAAMQLALGLNADPASGTTTMLALLLGAGPVGAWFVMPISLIVLGLGGFNFYMAATAGFQVDLERDRMSKAWRRTALVAGTIGYAARGLAFVLAGGMLFYTGWMGRRQMGGFLNLLQNTEFETVGMILLFVISAGLIAYGLYLITVAKFLRVITEW